jgi:uncharacterized protein (DUF952 family)
MHAQVPKTSDRFFADCTTLWLLKVPFSNVEKRIKWEGNSHGSFPHLYDENLVSAFGSKEVEEVLKFEKKREDSWVHVLAQLPH